ncbi:MAG: methylenetetrahydrofolate reductase [NAD(P)H] [Bacillota bacterium]|nr:methylenetetrahydrofolate reductase [NAD(P)H] [Bacillota bacterium]
MKIKELYKQNQPVLSLEVFPPKANYSLETVFATLDQLQHLKPGFISVTYGAGGATRGRTVEIASRIKKEYGIESLAHLTCVNHTKQELDGIMDQMLTEGIDNILALRGDPPENAPDFDYSQQEYEHAIELIQEINRKESFGIVAAAYPEGHPECPRLTDDLFYLRQKVEAGVDALITQLFFDNRIFYEFVERVLRMGISVPVVPGIMPVLNAKQIKRMIYLSGTSIPGKLLKLLDKYENKPEDMEKAGIEYASQQVDDLLTNKVAGVHLYTMNKWEQIYEIVNNVGFKK